MTSRSQSLAGVINDSANFTAKVFAVNNAINAPQCYTDDWQRTEPDYVIHLPEWPGGSDEYRDHIHVFYTPRKNVELRTQCRVKEVTVNSKGMAGGVLYYDSEGNLQEQKAEIVVMACNFFGDWLRDYLDPKLRRSR